MVSIFLGWMDNVLCSLIGDIDFLLVADTNDIGDCGGFDGADSDCLRRNPFVSVGGV
jgi:hypothetical protein